MATLTEEKLGEVQQEVLNVLEEPEPGSMIFNGLVVLVAARTGVSLEVVRGAISLLENKDLVAVTRSRYEPWIVQAV